MKRCMMIFLYFIGSFLSGADLLYAQDRKAFAVDSITNLFETFMDRYIAKDFDSTGYSKRSVWIIDLVDTLNNSYKNDFYFADKHIYVFSPARVRYAKYDYHNIAVLVNGKIRFFKAVNCPSIGDPINAVVSFVKDSMGSVPHQGAILKRIRACDMNGLKSVMRKMWPDDHDLIYDKFECPGKN